MNPLLGIRRLCWKESRQLLPLGAVILAVGTVFVLLIYFSPAGAQQYHSADTLYVLLILPHIFAIGAGALLVGQERENRTVEWLVNLPVAARHVLGSKFSISLLGLAGMWIASLILCFAISSLLAADFGEFLDVSRSMVLLLFLHSLLILLLGWAAAWRIKSTVLSLFAAALGAIVPPIAIQVLLDSDFAGPEDQQLISNLDSVLIPGLSSFGLIVMKLQLLGCLAVGWYGWRAGMRTLGPAAVGIRPGRHHRDDVGVMGYPSIRHNTTSSPWVALIWQHTRQIQPVLTTLLVFVSLNIVGIVGIMVTKHTYHAFVFSLPLTILAASWLAMSSFQGDGIQHRIRFLADRGVSPQMVWLTRQVVPFAVSLTSFSAVMAVYWSWFGLARVHRLELLYSGTGGCILLFAISQWSGQLISSPVVAAIASPLLSWTAIFLALTGHFFVPTPVWLVAVSTCIPFVATFVAMGRWMDGRLGISYWIWHAGCLVACLLLPTAPLLVTLATEPTISANASRVLMAHADRCQGIQGEPQNLVMPVPDSSVDDQRQFTFQELRRQLTAIAGPIGGYHVSLVTDYLQHEAAETRRSLHSTEKPSPEAIEQAAEPYRNALDLLVTIVGRMRLSPQLRDQNNADQLEIWLLRELQAPETRTWMGDDRYRAAVQLLADATARNNARRRAVALSWSRAQVELDQGDLGILFGGYALRASAIANPNKELDHMTWQQRVCGKRQASRAAWEFWQLLERNTAPTPEDLQRITSIFADRPEHISADEWPPARQWFGEWERQAMELGRDR